MVKRGQVLLREHTLSLLAAGTVLTAVSCSSGGITGPTGAKYRVIDLGALPSGQFSSASDINSAGQVVGTSAVPDVWPGATHIFLWEHGVMTDVMRPGENPNDPYTGEAAAINPAGQVVGWVRRMNGRPQAPWLWEQGVQRSFVNGEGYATDINPAGQVVGCLIGGWNGYGCHAALWENGAFTDLGTLAGGSSVAYGIDPTGRVVGQSDGHAFLWEKGTMTDLNIAGGESVARKSNAAGQVVGEVMVGGVTHGFFGNRVLPLILEKVVRVTDINSAGQVVGWRIVDGAGRGFVWEKGVMTELPGPSRAFGINDSAKSWGTMGELCRTAFAAGPHFGRRYDGRLRPK